MPPTPLTPAPGPTTPAPSPRTAHRRAEHLRTRTAAIVGRLTAIADDWAAGTTPTAAELDAVADEVAALYVLLGPATGDRTAVSA